MRIAFVLAAGALFAGGASPAAAADGRAPVVTPSRVAVTTSDGELASADWRCADQSGILPAEADPVGAVCARTFAAADAPASPASPLTDLYAASGGEPATPPQPGPGSWQLAPRTEPLRRTGAQIASDPARKQVVLFGGSRCQGASCFPAGDTWTWDGTQWTQRHPAASPPARFYGSMAFDPASGRILLFGGVGCADADCSAYAALDDTWTWDGANWRQEHPILAPPPRYLGAMAGDPAAANAVLFGGCIETCPAMAADTWAWDGSSWSLRTPGTSPSPRAAAGMAYDAARREVVLFGGSTPDTAVTGRDAGDTWTWDGSTWSLRAPPTSPSPREAVGMAYDATRGVTVLYGGVRADQQLYIDAYRRDTWLWDGTTWSEQAGEPAPPRTESPGLAHDAASGKTLLVGGTVFSPLDIPCGGCGVFVHERETWLLGAEGWSQVPSTWPDERSTAGFGGMAYYPKTRSAILTGGYCLDDPAFSCRDTWSWDGTTWTRLDLPRPVAFRPLVYDRHTRQLLSANGAYTWVFSLQTGWTLAGRNGPRVTFSALAQDPTGAAIQFGGAGSDSLGRRTYPRDTYRWNGSSWEPVASPRPPPGRQLAQAAYDPARGRTVLFGGIGCGKPTPINSCPFTYLDDTWAWDGGIWTEQAPPVSPPNRAFGALVENPWSAQLLLFGGVTQGLFYENMNDTWSWNGGTWTQEHPASAPGRLLNAFAAGLPGGGAVLFGGQEDNPGRTVSDLWTWSAAAAADQRPS